MPKTTRGANIEQLDNGFVFRGWENTESESFGGSTVNMNEFVNDGEELGILVEDFFSRD